MWRYLKFLHILHVYDVENFYTYMYTLCCFAEKLVLLWFTLFCREICFVAIYAHLCGEKLNQRLRMWRKKYEVCTFHILCCCLFIGFSYVASSCNVTFVARSQSSVLFCISGEMDTFIHDICHVSKSKGCHNVSSKGKGQTKVWKHCPFEYFGFFSMKIDNLSATKLPPPWNVTHPMLSSNCENWYNIKYNTNKKMVVNLFSSRWRTNKYLHEIWTMRLGWTQALGFLLHQNV